MELSSSAESHPQQTHSLPSQPIDMKITPGCIVRLYGLKARLDLNGQVGIVICFFKDRSRFSVLLDNSGGNPMLLKVENLELMADPKPIERGALVRVIKQGDPHYEEFGKVIDATPRGAAVQFSAHCFKGFKYESLLQCSGDKRLEAIAGQVNPFAIRQDNKLIQLCEVTSLTGNIAYQLLKTVGGDLDRAVELHLTGSDDESRLHEAQSKMDQAFAFFHAGDRRGAIRPWEDCLQLVRGCDGWRSKALAGRAA
eukprot:4577602-Prymnesium_polylepis.1